MAADASCLIIGLMSGTSLDGVDGVLARFDPTGKPEQLARASLDLPADLRQTLLALNTPDANELHQSAMAAMALSDLYAEVTGELLTQTALSASSIAAIGAHGQTVRHQPALGYTLQLLAPARLVERTGISVVADFRSRDVAAGGQGAPLVPAFHKAMLGHLAPCVVLNLGGIANVTLLSGNGSVLGFDTGPANLLLDHWCHRHHGLAYDQNGQWAQTGVVSQDLLQHLVASEPWFAKPAPKSTGRDLFDANWLGARLADFANVSAADVQATLVALTVKTVIDAIAPIAAIGSHWPIYVCGGGARNEYLMTQLQSHWSGSVTATDALGVGTQDMEALAFAWLAWAHLNKNAGNLAQVTGASGPRILGALWPA